MAMASTGQTARGRRRMERAEGAGLFTRREDTWAQGVKQQGHRRATWRLASVTQRSALVHVGHCCCYNDFKIPIPPQTYSWNINIPLFVTPKPFSFGMGCSNQSYRATWGLQLLLKGQSLIRHSLQDTKLQMWVPQNRSLQFSLQVDWNSHLSPSLSPYLCTDLINKFHHKLDLHEYSNFSQRIIV
jgi:hypothetical protein